MTNKLTAEDIYCVANDLCIGITNAQIEQVLEQYDQEQAEDPGATWNLVVEHIITNLKD